MTPRNELAPYLRGPGGTMTVTIRPGRQDEIPTVLDVWRRAEAVPGTTDTPADL